MMNSREGAGAQKLDIVVVQRGLDAIDDGALLGGQALALAAGPLGVFLGKGRDRHHLAVIPIAAQPAEEGTLEELGVQSVGLGTPVLTRHCHAGSVDDMRLDTACPEPPRQPEAVPAGLEGNGDACDLVADLLRLVSPSVDQLQQSVLARLELLQWLALDAGYDPGHEPVFLAELDRRD